MKYTKKITHPFKKGDKLEALIAGPGWLKGEYLAVDSNLRRNITIIGLHGSVSKRVYIEIIRDKDGIFLARLL